jgi:NADH dehydrogenase
MIVVTGGTGFIGRHVVARLRAQGAPVRLLLSERRAAGVQFEGENPPQIVIGTVHDEEALFRAMTGAHCVIHLENAQWWGRAGDLERIELEGARHLVAAARAARIGRIITLSHLGASSSSAYPILRVKGMVEEVVKSSGLAYTILRPGLIFGADDAFINHLAMQMATNPLFFLMPGRGETALHPLFIDDLVSAIVGSLHVLDAVDQTVEIGGPEYFTLAELLRTVMRVSRQPRVVVAVPPYALRVVIGVYRQVLPRALITGQWLDLLAANRTARLGTLYSVFGIRPRRLEDTLVTYMPGRHHGLAALRYTFRRRPSVL